MTNIVKKSLIFTNQHKLLLTLDWLTLNIDDFFQNLNWDEGYYQIGDYVVTLEDGGTNLFNYRASVFFSGDKVATLLFESKSKHILADRAHLKLENYLFYSGAAQSVLEGFISAFDIKDIRVSRVDIACDGVFLHEFLNSWLYGKKNEYDTRNIARVNDRDNIAPFVSDRASVANIDYDAFYIGSRGSRASRKTRSNKFGRYYNKTRELDNNSDKCYIRDYHSHNGFSGTVYRYEVQLSSDYLSTLSNFTYTDVFDQEKLESLFLSANKSFFEFYYKENSNVTKCQRIEIFSQFKQPLYKKVKKIVRDKTRTVRISIKRLASECFIGVFSTQEMREARKNTIDTIYNLIRVYQLEEWYVKVAPYWWEEIKIKSIQKNIKMPTDVQLAFFNK